MANLLQENSFGIVRFLAEHLGASEPALRLLLSILLGYPLALVHRKFFYGKDPNLQHLFFIVSGLLLGIFNYGPDIIHSVISVVVVYLVLLIIGGTALSVGVTFIFCMSYLLIGYYVTGTQEYDIKWSMPQCVLTLRLIGLAFDVYDGQKDYNNLPHDQKKTAITERPSLLEVAAHTYFFGGFLVGPQFPMKRYKDFINGEFSDKVTGGKPNCIYASLARLGLGFYFLITYQVGSLFLPERYLLTDDYANSVFWKKAVIMALWGRIALHKYVACWLLAEGSCTMTGLTYNGQDENGNDLWDGCANVKVYEFEVTTTFGGIIKSFNINTNLWVAQYIFKRLKFLGNKLLSQALALLFLAVWHGLHSGYYICFFNEFIVMKMEREFTSFVKVVPIIETMTNHSALQIPLYLLRKFYLLFFFGYCLTPFVLLSFDRWFKVYAAVYFLGHVVYLGWPVVHAFLKACFPRHRPPTAKATLSNKSKSQ